MFDIKTHTAEHMLNFTFLQGKGVGVSTLASLQNVDLVLHVLRDFEDENVTHYRAKVDPLRDLEIVNKEILYYVSPIFLLGLTLVSSVVGVSFQVVLHVTSFTHQHSQSHLLRTLQQDLDLIEAALTDLETIRHRQFGGDYLVYQMNTLLKVSGLVLCVCIDVMEVRGWNAKVPFEYCTLWCLTSTTLRTLYTKRRRGRM